MAKYLDINGLTHLKDKLTNLFATKDLATNNARGLVLVDPFYGIQNNDGGRLGAVNYTKAQFDSANNNCFLSKKTLTNLKENGYLIGSDYSGLVHSTVQMTVTYDDDTTETFTIWRN